jgi:hypothetical protein
MVVNLIMTIHDTQVISVAYMEQKQDKGHYFIDFRLS